MRYLSFLAVVLSFASIACGYVHTTAVVAAEPKPAGCPLDIYANPNRVARPHRVVCNIQSGSRMGTPVEAQLSRAREDACACGADALVVDSTTGASELSLSAIRYVEEAKL